MERRPGSVRRFLDRYGWRAYAIPILGVVTVVVILQVARTSTAAPAAATSPAATAGSPVSAASTATTVQGAPAPTSPAASARARVLATTGRSVTSASPSPSNPGAVAPATGTPAANSAAPAVLGAVGVEATAALPAGQGFVAAGKGTWHTVEGTSPVMGFGGRKYTFSIEVEDGIENAAADQDFAAIVDAALADPKSWIGSGQFQLQRVDTGTPSFRISLTSQSTVRDNTLCGWEIHYEASCYARGVKRVAINDARWARGAVSFNGDRVAYRVYAVNHEVGHALGFVHRPCPTNGGPAPVMMQQSWSTADNDLSLLNPQLIPMDGKVCTFNPYPFPTGPGATAVAGG